MCNLSDLGAGGQPPAPPVAPLSSVAQTAGPLAGASGGSAEGALGIITKSHPGLREINNLQTSRFALQSAAREVLPARHRTRVCLRNRRDRGKDVEVWRATVDRPAAHYGNLTVCGSVWACPVCAAKISERRREELSAAIAAHGQTGGDVVLVTLTFPHSRHDDLPDLLQRLRVAMTRYKSTWAARDVRAFIGWIGAVRALEVTHGEANGWHPHIHEIMFIEPGHDHDWVQQQLLLHWRRACRTAGLPDPSTEYGVDVRGAAKAAWYVAKFGVEDSRWGMEHELTKANLKRGRQGRCSPFDLLRRIVAGEDDRAAYLFREYALAFQGSRQLVWSRGLRDRLLSERESSDEELAAQPLEAAELLGQLTLHQWQKILRAGVRGEVLEAALSGWDAVLRLLDVLPSLERDARFP
jgi:hypothetical protein